MRGENVLVHDASNWHAEHASRDQLADRAIPWWEILAEITSDGKLQSFTMKYIPYICRKSVSQYVYQLWVSVLRTQTRKKKKMVISVITNKEWSWKHSYEFLTLGNGIREREIHQSVNKSGETTTTETKPLIYLPAKTHGSIVPTCSVKRKYLTL